METMNDNSTRKFLKLLLGLVLGGMILVVSIGMSTSVIVRAQDAWTETPTETSLRTQDCPQTPDVSANCF